MKVCVTGGTGYIGSWCIHYLLKDGHDVVTTVCDPASAKAKFLREGGKKTELIVPAVKGGRGGEDGREGERSRGWHRRRKEDMGRRGGGRGGRGREEGRPVKSERSRAEGGGGGRREASEHSMSVLAQSRSIKLPEYLGYLAGGASRYLALV
eukprot:1634788-Rhodomonas_salina.1